MGEVIEFPSRPQGGWLPIASTLRTQGHSEPIIERMRLFFEFIYRPAELVIKVPDDLPLGEGADVDAIREALRACFTSTLHKFVEDANAALFTERLDRENADIPDRC